MKKIAVIIVFLIPVNLSASGDTILEAAKLYYSNREYYNAVTEAMRYQHLYPAGTLFPSSMIIMGKSYFHGGDAGRSLDIFSDCYNRFPDKPQGEEGLYYSGIVRLLTGSYNFGVRTFQEYNFVYKGGLFYEESVFNLCMAKALAENYDDAVRLIGEYKVLFPEGKYSADADKLAVMVSGEKKRDKKNSLLAGLSSAIIPGSGYFYTGNYRLGAISLITNGALIFLAYDGYRKENAFQMLFFSVVEFSFYNYSIVGSIRSAQEYNNGTAFRKELLIGLKRGF